MAKLSPSEIAAKQVRKAQAATQDYITGVRNTEKKPMERAAAAVDKYAAGTSRAASDGSYVDGCLAVSDTQWKEVTERKGGRNYAQGVKDSENKIRDFHTAIAPHNAQVEREIDAMPTGTPEERIEKMVQNALKRGQFKYRKRRTS